MKLISHRGASLECPENSLESLVRSSEQSLRRFMELGADGVLLNDIRLGARVLGKSSG